MISRMGRFWLAAVLGATLLAGCEGAPAPYNEPVEPFLPYVIGPGDSMGIYVFRNPELSTTVVVRPDGRIALPLIPDIIASGRTPTQLAKDLEEKLKEFVKEPNVAVLVNGFNGPASRQVRVIGEATDPVAIPYRDQMTVLDVMIATHGLTRYAAGNRAVIIRRFNGPRQTIPVRLGDLIRDGDIDQNVAMAPGDTLIIPQSFF
ncbi:MAG TPA: XrtA/PEP-CTERM system exopolysaccharide export protein [Acetobacteraceae bacterium]|nr:XrtA/PEP-CTERM system exopolysaccharide export protein [Acetobacteraceae bacterium]